MIMTDNEAIKNVTAYVYMECENMPQQVIKALNIMKDATKEAQSYRAIGTVEECRAAVDRMNKEKIPIIHGKAEPEEHDKEIRDEALKEFIKRCDKACEFYEGNNAVLTREMILEIAEQMKGVVDER